MGNYAPTNPALKTIIAMVETTVKIMATFEYRDTPFDTGMPLASAAEPGLFLSLATLLRFFTRFGKHDPFDVSALSFGFIVGGEHATVGTGLGGWLPKELLVRIQTGAPLISITGVTIKHLPASDNPTFNFVQPDFATKLNGLPGFAAPDDGGVGLEDGDDLLVRRHLFILEHPADGLLNDLLCSGEESLQGVFQVLSLWKAALSEGFQDLLGLGNTLLCDLDQLAVGLLASCLPASHQTLHLAGCLSSTAGAIAENLGTQIGLF
jgi:hypothetical protein